MLAWKQNHEIFAITIKNIKKAFKSKLYADSQLFIFEKYHDLIDVFERQHIDKLFSHQKNMILKLNWN